MRPTAPGGSLRAGFMLKGGILGMLRLTRDSIHTFFCYNAVPLNFYYYYLRQKQIIYLRMTLPNNRQLCKIMNIDNIDQVYMRISR